MIAFASGIGVCLVYKKYEKDFMSYMQKMSKTLSEGK